MQPQKTVEAFTSLPRPIFGKGPSVVLHCNKGYFDICQGRNSLICQQVKHCDLGNNYAWTMDGLSSQMDLFYWGNHAEVQASRCKIFKYLGDANVAAEPSIK